MAFKKGFHDECKKNMKNTAMLRELCVIRVLCVCFVFLCVCVVLCFLQVWPVCVGVGVLSCVVCDRVTGDNCQTKTNEENYIVLFAI